MEPIPFARLFGRGRRRAVEPVVPRRTFDDVILPPATRRALDVALAHVTQHDLIFNRWGFAERHPTGLALAFNFAGPPGTGKTICADAIAHSLGRRLLVVRYAELESLWMGETPKNVAAIFKPRVKKVPCCCSMRQMRLPRAGLRQSIPVSSASPIR